MLAMSDSLPFWLEKPLTAMTPAEWESLCDGCGWCCMQKIEDSDTHEVFHTKVSCPLLDGDACRCSDYENRFARAPNCVKLTPENVPTLAWLPMSCAYRLLAEGRPLPSWHPLITGTRDSVHAAGMSVRGVCISADAIDDFVENYMKYVLLTLK